MPAYSALRRSALSVAAVAAVSLASLAMSGCATGTLAPSNEAVGALTPRMEGTAFGGATPISGATITLWETDPTSSGYPSSTVKNAKALATTTTYSGAVGTCANAPCTDSITAYSIASNLATFTANNTLVAHQGVTLSGFGTSTFFNGKTLYVTSATSTSFTVTFYHANVSATTESGTATEIVGSQAAGSWVLTSGYSCDTPLAGTAAPFLYLTATGGNTGAGVNNNSVLVSALGSCSYLNGTISPSTLHVTVNEATTVAAAYALGNFMYVDNTTPGSQNVYIGAPAANNAATGACTGTGSAMTCTAAGLSHAFNNAYNLVDNIGGSGFPNTTPTGGARTTIVANPMTGTAANPLASVPQAEIHAIANVVAGCVNSAGGSGTGGSNNTTDGTPCGNLFSKTPSAGGAVPTDTTTAMINLAQNPATNVGALYGYITASGSPYVPSLSLQPYDWSVAITYSGLAVSGTSSNFGFTSTASPEYVALDANDNVYVLAGNAATFAAATTSTMSSMTSAGVGIWANASTIDGAQGCYPGAVALDTNGNVWNSYQPSSGKTCTAAVLGRPTSGGAAGTTLTSSTAAVIQSSTDALAFDRYNNLWAGRNTSAGTTMMFQYPYSSGSYGAQAVTLNGANGSPAGTLASLTNIQIDSSYNVYATMYSSSVTGKVWVVPNTNAAALTSAPTYAGAATYLTQTLTTNHSGAMSLDSSGNIWAGETSGDFNRIVPSSTNSVITSLANNAVTVANASGTGAGTPAIGQIDSAGTFWFPSNTSSGQLYFFPTGTASSITAKVLLTCYAPAGGTTCSNVTYSGTGGTTPGAPSSSTAGPTVLQIDSTGSMWMTAETPGNVIQIVGSASPLWPQLSYGVFATKPH